MAEKPDSNVKHPSDDDNIDYEEKERRSNESKQ